MKQIADNSKGHKDEEAVQPRIHPDGADSGKDPKTPS